MTQHHFRKNIGAGAALAVVVLGGILISSRRGQAFDKDKGADQKFSNADLRGPYGWALEGTFAGNSLVAIRQFTADGVGKFSGEGTINLGTGGFQTTFDCSYFVKPNGAGTATCEVVELGRENFAFVLIDEGREVRFISVSDKAVIRGIARKQ